MYVRPQYSAAAVKDYNRGRHYLADLAQRAGVPVCRTVDAALAAVMHRLRTRPALSAATPWRAGRDGHDGHATSPYLTEQIMYTANIIDLDYKKYILTITTWHWQN